MSLIDHLLFIDGVSHNWARFSIALPDDMADAVKAKVAAGEYATDRRLQILTIGYERTSLADFLATLKAAGVQLLLDIRELPISRRKGFSKSALAAALAETGIEYSHERALGSPREIRYRLREDGDFARFFSDFREYLATQHTLLDTLARTTTGAVALLCYERNHAECHRSVVAEALARRARSTVRHLTVPHLDGQPLNRSSPTSRTM